MSNEFRYRDYLFNESPIKINLQLKIDKFGPITAADIKLKPLTIFVGPNNSGKSYAAMLTHSILTSKNQVESSFSTRYFARRRLIEKKIQHLDQNDLNKIKTLLKGDKFVIPSSITKKLWKEFINSFISNLSSEISRNFGSSLDELSQINNQSFKIIVSTQQGNIELENKFRKLKIISFPIFDLKISINKVTFTDPQTYMKRIRNPHELIIQIGKSTSEDVYLYDIIEVIFDTIGEYLKNDTPTLSYYFPAARSGILQGHRAISASIIRSAHYGGIEQIQIPKLSGVVSDFLSTIIELPDRKGPFFTLAENMENEILHGNIKLHSEIKGSIPEIKYHYLGKDIPLHRTSSTVSELAPFSLYLKYIIGRNSLLIIEEPEAHLHPHNQRILAKYLVRLIRSGLNMVITTHSVFLLEQLSNFLLMANIDPKNRHTAVGYDENDYLKPDEISAYVFETIADEGHITRPIEISSEDGISQEEFVKITESLNTEFQKIADTLNS